MTKVLNFLMVWALISSMVFVGFQLSIVARVLREKHIPVGRNEEPVELEGNNEPEPKKGR